MQRLGGSLSDEFIEDRRLIPSVEKAEKEQDAEMEKRKKNHINNIRSNTEQEL